MFDIFAKPFTAESAVRSQANMGDVHLCLCLGSTRAMYAVHGEVPVYLSI